MNGVRWARHAPVGQHAGRTWKAGPAIAAGLALLVSPPAVRAQSNGENGVVRSVLLPAVRHFASPVADPFEPRFAIGLVRTNLFESVGPERPDYTTSPGTDAEVQATAAIGATFPIALIAGASGSVVIAVQAGVFARFRIQKPSRDDLGQDWVVGVPIEMAWNNASARIRIAHRSSHLGDEFSESTGAQRVEVGGETIDGLFALRFGAVRVYGGGGWVFHSNTDNTDILRDLDREDRFTLQAGGDAEFRPFTNRRLSIVAGADWQSNERTNWHSMFALAAAIRATAGSRDIRFTTRYSGGASALGQFFLTREQAWSVELAFGL